MQFFYTGEVSLASQDDIQPLKEACLILGVSSLMARLEELSFSMQCLPNGYDQQPPFRPTTVVTDPPALSGDDNSNLGIDAVVAQGPTSGGNDGSVVNAFETTSTAQIDLSKREPEPGISTPPAPTPEEAVAAVTAAAAADEDDFEASFNEIVEQREEPQPSDLPPVPPSHPMPPTLTKAPPQLQQQKAFSAIHEPPPPPQPAPPPLPLPPSTMKKRPFPCGQCSSRFHSAESLAAHERMHAGKKPFVWDAIQCCRDTLLKDYITI